MTGITSHAFLNFTKIEVRAGIDGASAGNCRGFAYDHQLCLHSFAHLQMWGRLCSAFEGEERRVGIVTNSLHSKERLENIR